MSEMKSEMGVSGDWLVKGSTEHNVLQEFIGETLLAIERNEYELVLRFSSGFVLRAFGGSEQGGAMVLEPGMEP